MKARHGSAGCEWEEGTSPVGTAPVLTHTLQPQRVFNQLTQPRSCFVSRKLVSFEHRNTMHRPIARLLLLFALVGNLLPLALASASAQRACCLRKGVHHCQNSLASESEPLFIRDASCCNHDCRRAVTTAQWAHPQAKQAAFFPPTVTAPLTGTEAKSPANASAEFQSSRAPPAC